MKDLWGLYMSILNIRIRDKTKVRQQDREEDDSSEDEMSLLRDEASSDEEQFNTTTPSHKKGEFRSDVERLKGYPALILSPLFSYLAIIILKLPVSLNEIYQYIPLFLESS